MCPDSDSNVTLEQRLRAVIDPFFWTCVNCCRWSENLPECQLVREGGFTVCSMWPDNNLPESERHD